MEKYQFNSEMFAKVQAQKRLSKRDILRVLGTQDYASLTKWLSGVGSPSVEQIVKICNAYDVSPAQWFLHNGEPEKMTVEENPYQVTKMVAGEGMVTENEFLKMQLAHAQEVMEIERNARMREDQIRRDCQVQFDKERTRLMDLIERLNNEVLRQKRATTSSNGYMVGEPDPDNKDCTD